MRVSSDPRGGGHRPGSRNRDAGPAKHHRNGAVGSCIRATKSDNLKITRTRVTASASVCSSRSTAVPSQLYGAGYGNEKPDANQRGVFHGGDGNGRDDGSRSTRRALRSSDDHERAAQRVFFFNGPIGKHGVGRHERGGPRGDGPRGIASPLRRREFRPGSSQHVGCPPVFQSTAARAGAPGSAGATANVLPRHAVGPCHAAAGDAHRPHIGRSSYLHAEPVADDWRRSSSLNGRWRPTRHDAAVPSLASV